jgi:putative flippase GtrA
VTSTAGTRQFVRFLVTGGIAAVANYSSRFLFSEFMRFEYAVILAYLVGMFTAFLLMRQFVFEGRDGSLRSQAFWFTAVNGFALLQTFVVSVGLVWLLPKVGLRTHVEAVAHLIGVITPVFTSFLGHKHLSFRAATRDVSTDREH